MDQEREKIEKELDKKVDEKISKALESEFGPNLDKIIEEKVNRKLEEKILGEVDQKIEEKTALIEPEEAEVTGPEKKRINIIVKEINEFKTSFRLCWQGSCKIISVVMLMAYVFISLVLLSCHFLKNCGVANTTVPTYIIYIIIAMVLISFLFSLFSSYPRTSIFFWILLDIPILILVIIITAHYIALIILSLVIVLRIVQSLRSY